MAKDLNPKCKKCRRAGEKLFLKGDRCSMPKCAMVKRNYPPGFHGPKGKGRSTDYATQLNEKQKAKRQYNLLEKQFKLTFDKASSQSGNTGEIFMQLLEMRFDNVIFRLGLASSRAQARQLINHGHFMINDHKVSIPSYHVKIGDVIKIKNNKKNNKNFRDLKERLAQRETVEWVSFDASDLTGKILNRPAIQMLKPNFNIQMIIEFYSR